MPSNGKLCPDVCSTKSTLRTDQINISIHVYFDKPKVSFRLFTGIWVSQRQLLYKRNHPRPRTLMVTHESWSTSVSSLTWISATGVSIPQWLFTAYIKHVWRGRPHKSQKISKFYGSFSFLFQSKQRTRNSLYRPPTLYIIHSFFNL